MVSDRPKPKYGELAPEGWVWHPPAAPEQPESALSHPEERATPPESAAPDPDRSGGPAQSRPRPIDMSLTSVFLFLGVLFTATMLPTLFDFSSALKQGLALQGYTSFTPSDATNSIGVAAGMAMIVLQLVSIVISILRLSRRRLAFPFPLVFGVASFAIGMGAILIAFFTDPSFVQQFSAR